MSKSKKNIIDKILYNFIIFLLGAVAGYIYEVIFYYITLGILNNWGVLYGPYLPIYGIEKTTYLFKISSFISLLFS